MKKAIRFTYYLAMYVVGLCIIAMAFSYFNDWLMTTGFFGDTIRKEKGQGPDEWHDWSNRHYWYFWTCFVLVILSIARIVVWAVFYWEEKK